MTQHWAGGNDVYVSYAKRGHLRGKTNKQTKPSILLALTHSRINHKSIVSRGRALHWPRSIRIAASTKRRTKTKKRRKNEQPNIKFNDRTRLFCSASASSFTSCISLRAQSSPESEDLKRSHIFYFFNRISGLPLGFRFLRMASLLPCIMLGENANLCSFSIECSRKFPGKRANCNGTARGRG